jgi:hypothetical protein
MKEIGITLGCTESSISQIHRKAIAKLKTRLAKKLRPDDLPWIQFPGRTSAVKPKRMHLHQVAVMK